MGIVTLDQLPDSMANQTDDMLPNNAGIAPDIAHIAGITKRWSRLYVWLQVRAGSPCGPCKHLSFAHGMHLVATHLCAVRTGLQDALLADGDGHRRHGWWNPCYPP